MSKLATFGVTWIIALDMFLDRIGQTTGLLHKIKFYDVCGKMLFLIESFLVEDDYKLFKAQAIV